MARRALSPDIIQRVERMVGSRLSGCEWVRRGYTAAARCILTFENGCSAFCKAATGPDTASWLRTEIRVYEQLQGAFLPRFLGWDEGDEWPFMLLEDLGDAAWPPPWTTDRIDAVLAALAEVQASVPPGDLPRLEEQRTDLSGWPTVAEQPEAFLALRLCSREWLEAALPELLAAEAATVLDGSVLLHSDVRSDNVCFRDGRAVLVDWNHACVGNPVTDVLTWLPSLHAEGGPEPEAILAGEPEFVSLLAGYWAARAGLPPPFPGSSVREVQLQQLRVALPWAARQLGLPPPA